MDKRILIVDDDPKFTHLLIEYLQPLGFELIAANSRAKALESYKKKRPRVVLLDFQMPEITGEKFLRELQVIDPQVRAIVITGYDVTEVEDKFKGAGYFAFFMKGTLSLAELKAKIEEALAL